ASPHDWKGVPQGLAALEAYLADVADPAKDFENAGPWFCWAAFERLTVRSCCARWLRQAADVLGGDAKKSLQAAAKHYERAAEFYEQYRAESGSGITDGRTLREQARTPEKIAILVPILKAAIAEERAGVVAMARAVGVDPGTAFTPEQKQRLLQWQNIYGWSLEKCLDGAAHDPEIWDLLALELSLEPISREARTIRNDMLLMEPADLTYWPLAEAIIAAIGSPETLAGRDHIERPTPGWPERQRQVKLHARALQHWLDGDDPAKAKAAGDSDNASVDQVYRLLGGADDDKKLLVSFVIEKLDRGDLEHKPIDTLRENEKLADFAHRIEMLDAVLWSYDRNFALLLEGIGRLQPVGEWHKPGGPLAWSDGNPEDAPKIKSAITALDVWLAGKPSDHPFAIALGDRAAYKEKAWLVRCMAVYLKDHLGKYYAAAGQ
ncbi:MAG TPA: hypothetical protein VM223_26940, partial [Planctomycetota bacterium]|nr:hypothetical protein [Planctomycetota bacterium]